MHFQFYSGKVGESGIRGADEYILQVGSQHIPTQYLTFTIPLFSYSFLIGGASIKHTGNMRCLHIIEMQRTAYDSASKYRRSEIAERVVSLIHESGGRFLKPVKGGWQEVGNDVAKNKISHYFRRVRSDQNKKQSANPVTIRSREDEVESLGGNQEKRSRK